MLTGAQSMEMLFGGETGDGAFLRAGQGTLFLDEIGAMPAEQQSLLLKVLDVREVESRDGERHPVLARIIAATNEEPDMLIDQGRLRPDLYYRLNVVHLRVPPLTERREDIGLLFRHFCATAAERHGKPVPQFALTELTTYGWPGNIRELQSFRAGCVGSGRSSDRRATIAIRAD